MQILSDFPLLAQTVNGKPLVYLDTAASSQKPVQVLSAMHAHYCEDYANIHRGIHTLSERATRQYEAARQRVQEFLHARESREIVFVRGTTEAINLVAGALTRQGISPEDEILISEMEHHSNIVPWQLLCEQTGARLKMIPITDTGELDLATLDSLLTDRTRLLAITHVSNVLGTINPVEKIIALAHARHIPVLLDGAQAVSHLPVDVTALDCDFYTFSAHKMYGPTGIGVLYGKAALLEKLPPWQGGGGMIRTVHSQGSTWADIPQKFEAGTPAIAEAIGLAAAMDYIENLGMDAIARHETHLLQTALSALETIPGLRLLGSPARRAAVLSFVLEGVHAHDVATILDQSGVAVRAGHHCAMPLMTRMGIPACVRVSFGIYNTEADIAALVAGLQQVREIFHP